MMIYLETSLACFLNLMCFIPNFTFPVAEFRKKIELSLAYLPSNYMQALQLLFSSLTSRKNSPIIGRLFGCLPPSEKAVSFLFWRLGILHFYIYLPGRLTRRSIEQLFII